MGSSELSLIYSTSLLVLSGKSVVDLKMAPKVVLITGASRGIGLALVKEYLFRNYHVVATCRNPDKASELTALQKSGGDLRVLACDVANDESVGSCFHSLTDINVDLLINNAGISNKDHPDDPPSNISRPGKIHEE